MLEYTIEVAATSILDDWFVFTDKYTQYRTYGIIRPPEMSGGEKDSIYTWLPYAVSEYEKKKQIYVDAIMLLQPTSPLRTAYDINMAINCFSESQVTDIDSLYSGYYFKLKHEEKRYNKDEDKPHFQRNGAVFIIRRDLLDKGKLWSNDVIKFVMPEWRSIDVDTIQDIFVIKSIIKNGGLKNGDN